MDKATTQKFLDAFLVYTGIGLGEVEDARVVEDPMFPGTYAARIVATGRNCDFLVTGCNPNTMGAAEIADLIEECEFDVFPPKQKRCHW